MSNTRLDEALSRLKNAKDAATMPKHEAWVPAPEKEQAKLLGVKWNSAAKRFEFAAIEPQEHPCARYLPTNYIQLKAQIPYESTAEFKEFGVLTTKVDGKWQSYVMADEKYSELITGLGALELL
jgi:hypothetical protein